MVVEDAAGQEPCVYRSLAASAARTPLLANLFREGEQTAGGLEPVLCRSCSAGGRQSLRLSAQPEMPAVTDQSVANHRHFRWRDSSGSRMDFLGFAAHEDRAMESW